MKKKMMVVCLMMVTVVTIGKIGLSYVQPSNIEPHLQPLTKAIKPLPDKEVVQQQALLLKGGNWLMDEIIPSAEAAKSLILDEERNSASMNEESLDIQKKLESLNLREEALDEREQEIEDAEKRTASKVAALEALQIRIQAMLDEENSIKDKKIKRLTSVYEGMKADKAAPVIAQMDLNIVVKMFLRMKEKQVGKILSFLPPQQAVVISQALTKRIALVSD